MRSCLASPSGGVGGSMWTLRPCICILPFHAACISLCLMHLELVWSVNSMSYVCGLLSVIFCGMNYVFSSNYSMCGLSRYDYNCCAHSTDHLLYASITMIVGKSPSNSDILCVLYLQLQIILHTLRGSLSYILSFYWDLSISRTELQIKISPMKLISKIYLIP